MQLFAPVFDASLLLTTLALFSGATLVTARSKERTDARALAELIARTSPTIASFVPSAFRAIDTVYLEGVRMLIFGGEPLTNEDIRRAGNDRQVINSYGATETAVCVCAWKVDRHQHHPVPIGRPIANNWVGVIDAWGRLVPDGCPGEIDESDLYKQRFDLFFGVRLFKVGHHLLKKLRYARFTLRRRRQIDCKGPFVA